MRTLMEDCPLLQITAGLEDLAPIRDYIRVRAAALKIDASTTYDLLLAVTEIVTNMLVHGYQKKAGFVEVEVNQEGNTLVVHLRDRAAPFDPTRVKPPDLSLPLEKRPLGGMGIYLVNQMVDTVSHRNLPQGGNEITLVINGISARIAQEGSNGNAR